MKKKYFQVNIRFTLEQYKELNYVRYHKGYTTMADMVRDLILEEAALIRNQQK